MYGRLTFLAFLLGLLLGVWLGDGLRPSRQLKTRVDCAPALEGI